MTENELTAGYESLGADINKAPDRRPDEAKEGVVSPKLPELTLDMSDKDILALTKKRKKEWKDSAARAEWEKKGNENERYWLGKQFEGPRGTSDRPLVDNVIFEALETYLPKAMGRNPEPSVALGPREEQNEKAQQYARLVKDRLAEIADKKKLRLKLLRVARQWGIRLIAVVKYGWDLDHDIPAVQVVRAQRLILDPKATIDEDGYSGQMIGEYRNLPASTILSVMKANGASPESVKFVNDKVGDDKATELEFIEWWDRGYMCWEMSDKLLMKRKNPHWNYASEDGAEGINHFDVPEMPYDFLTVFNLGDQPMDNTSLIGQNLSSQDLINKKNKQITKNTDGMNGGMVVSLARSGLTETQAKQVTTALANGGTICIPDGAPRESIDRYAANPLPSDVFNQLSDTRNRLREIFGTQGSSAAGVSKERTVRGKLITAAMDTDRIGGGVTQYLEQLADNIFNWMVQLLYVYDDGFQGAQGARPPAIVVSVVEGSLLPKDSTTIANQAIELASAGKMSILDMYKRLEYPNPDELAANVWLEANAPELLFAENPKVKQAMEMRAQAAQAGAKAEQKPPSVSIALKDLPPEGQAQAAAQAGIQITPEAVAQHAVAATALKALPDMVKRHTPPPDHESEEKRGGLPKGGGGP